MQGKELQEAWILTSRGHTHREMLTQAELLTLCITTHKSSDEQLSWPALWQQPIKSSIGEENRTSTVIPLHLNLFDFIKLVRST